MRFWPWLTTQAPTTTAAGTSREEIIAAIKPFAFLCESHVTDEMKDTTGIVYPGSKACICVGDLRRAREALKALEGEGK